jgi:hypothetical protein
MFNKRSMSVAAAFVFFGSLVVSTADAQQPGCYTVASLNGQYAITGTYGANVAIALAMRYFDGNGNLTGTFVVNEPTPGSSTGARTIVTGTQVGTYTVNCDGTGVITRTVTASNGVTAIQMDDFIITGATATYISYNPVLLATALADATRVPSAIVPGGVLLTRTYTRLPDRFGATQP